MRRLLFAALLAAALAPLAPAAAVPCVDMVVYGPVIRVCPPPLPPEA